MHPLPESDTPVFPQARCSWGRGHHPSPPAWMGIALRVFRGDKMMIVDRHGLLKKNAFL